MEEISKNWWTISEILTKSKWSQIHLIWWLCQKMYCLILRFDFLQTLNSQKNKTTKTEKEIRQTLYMIFGLLQS